MAKYFVSLAIKRMMNYEGTVEADSEIEAYEKMVEDFENNGGIGEVDEEYCGDDELAVGDEDRDSEGNLKDVPVGVHIEKED